MVAPRIKANIDFLRRVARCSSERKRNKFINDASEDELLAIAEIALNTLRGRVSLTKPQKNKLKQVADDVRKLSRIRSVKAARDIIQKGGGFFLKSLLTPVLLEVGRYLLNNGSKLCSCS